MSCYDCELYGPCNGRHGCAKCEIQVPYPYTVRDALQDIAVAVAIIAAVALLAINVVFWLH